MKPKHSATSRFISLSLFDALDSFDALEARISALPSNKEIGDAFEIFTEAYFATQEIAHAKEVWPARPAQAARARHRQGHGRGRHLRKWLFISLQYDSLRFIETNDDISSVTGNTHSKPGKLQN